MTRSAPLRRVSLSTGWVLAAPRNVHGTLLLPVPRDCSQVPGRPRKSLREGIAAAPQGLWQITKCIWHQASPLTTLFQHQQMWPFSGVCGDQVALTVSTKCPSSSGTAFPCVAREPPRPHSAPGDLPFPPEHHQVSSCGCSLCTPLVYSLNGI